MAKTKAQKADILSRLQDALKKTGSSVVVHFKGLSVKDESMMRRELKEKGLAYFVAKKTLIKKAITDGGLGEVGGLEGEVAVVYNTEASDTTAPARLAYEYSKQFGAERFSLLNGIFEEKLQGQEGILEIATIPPTPVLRGMFVNVINSPIQGLVIALNGIAEKKQ